MKRVRNAVHSFSTIALAVALALAGGTALAKGPPTGGEGEGNRLSYPVIFPEGVTPAGFPTPNVWTFAEISESAAECTTGAPVLDTDLCYWDGDQVWWLAARAGNFWKAFSMAPASGSGPVAVTAVDVGDKLESSTGLNLTRIRTEFTLYQNALADERFADLVPTFEGGVLPVPFAAPCETPVTAKEVGCFAAFNMSGAVPGTDQSIDEIQGTDFGVNTATNSDAHSTATGLLIDPNYKGLKDGSGAAITTHATVYSKCARLLIQKLGTDAPAWNPVDGQWDNASAPVVNVAAYTDLGQGLYSAEINAGGNLIYGYNWNASRDSNGGGKYRLTFVLDGPPRCPLNTEFDLTTKLANPQTATPAIIVPAGDWRLGETSTEGGLVYIDLTLVGKGGGGGGGGGKGPKPRP